MNYKKVFKNQPLHPLSIGRNDHSKESKHSMQSKNVFPSKIMVFLQLLTIATPAKTRYSAFTYTISYIYIQIMYQPHPGLGEWAVMYQLPACYLFLTAWLYRNMGRAKFQKLNFHIYFLLPVTGYPEEPYIATSIQKYV